MKTQVYNLEGLAVSEIELPDGLFAREWNADLVHQVAVAQKANARSPWAHVKGRGEVRGGGRKPWKQKHTGRARQGSIRSPIWKGGGVSLHGPNKERSYEQKVNKKMKMGALAAVLSKRLSDAELKIVDSLPSDISKTKLLMKALMKMAPEKNALLIPGMDNKNIYRASRHLSKVAAISPRRLNVVELLKYKKILLDKDAVKTLSAL